MIGEKLNKQVKIEGNFTEEEWRCIGIFKRKVIELLNTGLVAQMEGSISLHLGVEIGKALSIKTKLPPEDSFRSFLMGFRFFYLTEEPSNFLRVSKIIKRKASNKIVTEFIDGLKSIWSGSIANETVQLNVNGEMLTSSRLLDLWFNAHYFHSDKTKEADLQRLNGALTDEMSKYFFANAVYEAFKAVIKLYYAIHTLEQKSKSVA